MTYNLEIEGVLANVLVCCNGIILHPVSSAAIVCGIILHPVSYVAIVCFGITLCNIYGTFFL
jgi:hypothetical protein